MTDAAERVEHRYKPVGSARELFTSRDSEVLLSGPAGTGKSRGCLEKIHAVCMKYPGMRAAILRKTATSLTSTALVTFREHVAKEALLSGEVKFFGGSSQEASVYKYGNGSTITVGGMDKATRIMSSEYDVVYVQEATELSENDWEAITTRLRHGAMPYQQLIADCNPDVPYHWLKNRCDSGRTKIIYCRHEDNPTLYNPATDTWTPAGTSYIDKLNALTGVRYERLRLGKWAAADGLIFDEWDPEVHLRNGPAEPPLDWTRYWSIDFGYKNPFVWQAWAQDPDGRLYLYREIYMTGRTVEDHCKTIQKWQKTKRGPEPPPQAVVCDHDAEGRATLEEHLGITTVKAHKSVMEGIEAVKSRLAVQGDGKPRLFIARNALVEIDGSLREANKPKCTEEEILEYVWGHNVTHDTNRTLREAPEKKNDHGMDAMRYVVAQVDLMGRGRVRVLTW